MQKRMLLALILASACASAQEVSSQKGLEMGLTYREGDPFLFCEPWNGGQGWRNTPDQCWVPLDPISGTYTPMFWCDPPNPYGKPWSQDDYRSLQQYQTICRQAVERGTWDNKNQQYYEDQPIRR